MSLKERSSEVRAALEALARKERSEAILAAEGVPINAALPLIEAEPGVPERNSEDVAHRAMALIVVAMRAERMAQQLAARIIAEYGLEPYLTPLEQAFLRRPQPSEKDMQRFSWRYESAWMLLWALGFEETAGRPDRTCDVARVVASMRDRRADQFIDAAKMRPMTQILEEADLVYRYHWAVVDARMKQQPPPAGLHPGVLYERHYALNWLIGYCDQEWDEVTTDT